jgi:hypothetical protein
MDRAGVDRVVAQPQSQRIGAQCGGWTSGRPSAADMPIAHEKKPADPRNRGSTGFL